MQCTFSSQLFFFYVFAGFRRTCAARPGQTAETEGFGVPQDYGYFGKGIPGYLHYNLAYKRNFSGGKKPPGSRKGGCLTTLALLMSCSFLLILILL